MKWLYPEELNPKIILTSYYVCPPPFAPCFRAPGLFMMFVVSGEVACESGDGEQWVGRRHDLICYYPGRHRYRVLGDKPLSFYQVHFYACADRSDDVIPALVGHGPLPNCLPIRRESRRIVELFEQMMVALAGEHATWVLETRAALLELIQRGFQEWINQPNHPALKLHQWEALLWRMEQSEAWPTVSSLAEDFGLSTEAFIRQFKKRMGITPKQYMIQRRLRIGRRLLVEGAPVKEAALQCGFKDPLYFSRLYTKQFGHPPSAAADMPVDENHYLHSGIPVSQHLVAPDIDWSLFRSS